MPLATDLPTSPPSTHELLGEIIAMAHQSAVTHGYTDDAAVTFLKDMEKDAVRRVRSQSPELAEKQFRHIQEIIGKKDDAAINQLSRLTALDTLLANATGSAARAAETPSAEDEIYGYLKKAFAKAESIDEKNTVLAALKEGLDNIIISLTYTIHPTIYHTMESRRFEADLTRLLENPSNITEGRFNDTGRKEVQALLDHFVAQLASGDVHITPHRQITVGEETVAEKENLQILRQEMGEIVKAWNAASARVASEESVSPEPLAISGAQEKKLFELRTWGQAADADGREKATSQFLYASIQDSLEKNIENGHYNGPIFDLRQNASAHRDYLSALIQVKYRHSKKFGPNGEDRALYGESATGPKAFWKFCDDFMKEEGRQEKYNKARQEHENGNGNGNGDYMGWYGPDDSIFQQLDAGDRADFVSKMIREGFNLIPSQVKTDTLEFNQAIYPLRKEFLAQHAQSISEAGHHHETIDYNGMLDVSVPFEDSQATFRPLWRAEAREQGWQISEDELNFQRILTKKNLTKENLQVENFLQGTYKMDHTDKGWKQKKLNAIDVAVCENVGKRMLVMEDAIKQAKARGDTIATRYEIANFSQPADFLIAIKLFADTGLAQIENGKVKSTELGIMPLLETEKDLQQAPALFKKLLEKEKDGSDSIATSFWKARGKVEIMLGFSDGSMSAGNFASQWAIYKASRELTELFAREGLQVEFFQGRGRGVDRGGTIEPKLQAQLMPPEVTCHGRYDVTIQSDLPMDMVASQSYGQHYLTQILTSTLDGYVHGKDTRQRLEKMRKGEDLPVQRDSREEGVDAIAAHASGAYRELVRNNPAVLALLNNSPNNSFRSSRTPSRGSDESDKIFRDMGEVRVITFEGASNGAELSAANAGLKTGIESYTKSCGENADKKVGKVFSHPFVQAVTQTILAGLADFNSAIAHAHGHAYEAHGAKYKNSKDSKFFTGAADFTRKVAKEVTGLDELLAKYTQSGPDMPANGFTHRVQKGDNGTLAGGDMAHALDHIGHGIITSLLEKGKSANPDPKKPNEKQLADTLLNSLFVTVQEIGHKQLPREQARDMSGYGK